MRGMNTNVAAFDFHSPRPLGPFAVPPIGLGCMNLSHAYGVPPSVEAAERLLLSALDAGVALFDTAALYGFGTNELLVGRVLRPHRSRIVLCSKGGMTGETFPDGIKRVINGRPEAIRRHCEASLKRLHVDVIDLYYLHRWDKAVPIEDSVGEMARLVQAGKVRAIGLSEVSAATLRKAHAVHPIAALQTEYSPWTRNPEIAVLQACREIGCAFVAFSPVARGYLTNQPPDIHGLDPKDIRLGMPRFSAANWPRNMLLHHDLLVLAQEAGLTLAQLSLAWVLSRGEHVLAIPGTTQLAHLLENMAAARAQVAPTLLERLSALLPPGRIVGDRYGAASAAEVDTEVFAH
jgi:aryl-alcohol dehydrogenase-like predicted oxidoreductase